MAELTAYRLIIVASFVLAIGMCATGNWAWGFGFSIGDIETVVWMDCSKADEGTAQ